MIPMVLAYGPVAPYIMMGTKLVNRKWLETKEKWLTLRSHGQRQAERLSKIQIFLGERKVDQLDVGPLRARGAGNAGGDDEIIAHEQAHAIGRACERSHPPRQVHATLVTRDARDERLDVLLRRTFR